MYDHGSDSRWRFYLNHDCHKPGPIPRSPLSHEISVVDDFASGHPHRNQPLVVQWPGVSVSSMEHDRLLFAIAVSIPIYLLLSIVSYMRIYLIICRHRLKIRAQRNAVANSTQDYQRKHNMERKSKSAKNTFMYFVVMVVCYLPLFTAMIILTFYTSLWTIAWNLTDTIAFANSAINPFLYCWRVRELRTAVIKVAKRILCRQTEDN